MIALYNGHFLLLLLVGTIGATNSEHRDMDQEASLGGACGREQQGLNALHGRCL